MQSRSKLVKFLGDCSHYVRYTRAGEVAVRTRGQRVLSREKVKVNFSPSPARNQASRHEAYAETEI
jgi:hypothetical protein